MGTVRKLLAGDVLPPLMQSPLDRGITTAPKYSRASFDPERLRGVAHWAAKAVRAARTDAIVAIGHSGLVMAGAVSLLTGLPVFAVRKKGEERSSHDPDTRVHAVAKDGAVRSWVFLDDMIASGETLRHAAASVWESHLVRRPHPDVILLYTSVDYKHRVDQWVWRREVDMAYPWHNVPEIDVLGYHSEEK